MVAKEVSSSKGHLGCAEKHSNFDGLPGALSGSIEVLEARSVECWQWLGQTSAGPRSCGEDGVWAFPLGWKFFPHCSVCRLTSLRVPVSRHRLWFPQKT